VTRARGEARGSATVGFGTSARRVDDITATTGWARAVALPSRWDKLPAGLNGLGGREASTRRRSCSRCVSSIGVPCRLHGCHSEWAHTVRAPLRGHLVALIGDANNTLGRRADCSPRRMTRTSALLVFPCANQAHCVCAARLGHRRFLRTTIVWKRWYAASTRLGSHTSTWCWLPVNQHTVSMPSCWEHRSSGCPQPTRASLGEHDPRHPRGEHRPRRPGVVGVANTRPDAPGKGARTCGPLRMARVDDRNAVLRHTSSSFFVCRPPPASRPNPAGICPSTRGAATAPRQPVVAVIDHQPARRSCRNQPVADPELRPVRAVTLGQSSDPTLSSEPSGSASSDQNRRALPHPRSQLRLASVSQHQPRRRSSATKGAT